MHKILFVGNSYTFFHDMPTKIFAPLANALEPWEVTEVTKGGYHLLQFADPNNEQGKRLRATIKDKHFDVAVLQDHSLAAVLWQEEFDESVAQLTNLLRPNVDNFVLFATWGRKTGCPTLDELGLTSAQMTDVIAQAYDRVAAKYGSTVAHVGKAFAEYASLHPECELYFEDMHHPSELGSVLAAQTILNVIRNL